MAERLQKIIAQWGIASRRRAEALIELGQVRVNGEPAVLGQKVDPDCDRIEVQGKLLKTQTAPKRLYLLVNKPAGVVSTCDDPWGRPTVLSLLPPELAQAQGLHPVGRLDQETTGALLLTNDGELTCQLTHPRYHHPKTYWVWVKGFPTAVTLEQWRRGIVLEEGKTLPAQVKRLVPVPKIPGVPVPNSSACTCLEIVLTEGRKRQIRRVAKSLGHPVVHLHRAKIGDLALFNQAGSPLLSGEWRFLEAEEVEGLRNPSTQKIKVARAKRAQP
jgi:23S rRNA pseudouridine2605 synthase